MKPTTIYLIRYGEVDNPKDIIYGCEVDVSLSDPGHSQMESFGKYLKSKGVMPRAIYSSLLVRAKQSAEEIVKSFDKIPIIYDNRLREVNCPGLEKFTLEWERSIGSDLYNYHGKEMKGVELEMPDEQARRMTTAIKDILREYKGKTVFVVSHGDPLAFTLWRLLNPKGRLPSIKFLRKDYYLQKGTAWKVVFDEENKVVEHELIAVNK